MLILVCNVGSTSLKYKLFDMPSAEAIVECRTERVGREDAIFTYKNNRSGFSDKAECLSIPDYASGIRLFLKYLLDEKSGALESIDQLDAVGFKTVLAKGFYGVHELTDDVISAMEAYVSVAPAHNPPYIQAIKVFKEILSRSHAAFTRFPMNGTRNTASAGSVTTAPHTATYRAG